MQGRNIPDRKHLSAKHLSACQTRTEKCRLQAEKRLMADSCKATGIRYSAVICFKTECVRHQSLHHGKIVVDRKVKGFPSQFELALLIAAAVSHLQQEVARLTTSEWSIDRSIMRFD